MRASGWGGAPLPRVRTICDETPAFSDRASKCVAVCSLQQDAVLRDRHSKPLEVRCTCEGHEGGEVPFWRRPDKVLILLWTRCKPQECGREPRRPCVQYRPALRVEGLAKSAVITPNPVEGWGQLLRPG